MENKIVVRYGNYLNSLEFKGFTASDFDFLMFLCAVMKDKDEDITTISISKIKKVVKYDKHVTTEDFSKLLESMNDKLMRIRAKVKNGSRTIQFVLFPTFITDTKTGYLTVRVNTDFKYLLSELTKNFTRFELKEFIELNSKYAKTLYRLLKQFKATGEYFVKVEELKGLLDCPESCNDNRYFAIKILVPAVKELEKHFKNLKYETVKAPKRGQPIIGYRFTFTPEANTHEADTASADRQDQGQTKKKRGRPRKTQFDNFAQRDYNFEELEKILLS